MTKYTASSFPTICEEGADPEIFTAYIDVENGIGGFDNNSCWVARLSVHGDGKEGAEALRNEVLKALQLRALLKEVSAA